ncbi:DUF4238 domain-containing protein [Limibaculum sp. M0105]|uniref:DUF4238 domain-containing protein n=1 Tax=Thermohalobaculum xanthum TaxID=2753746 RepID=A0A8J7M5C7_9RHOB|nr:DUF4238 domain-containing protein [Thermohalobaculum xanthum]MBK0398654.1 DUF4238 domain-containing protein [Thermohalobaculum xanthum]
MAGRKQHFIPQLLQRGFSTRRKNENYVHTFFRDGRYFFTNTINIGAERDFYTFEGASSLDDAITHYEDSIHSALRLISCHPSGPIYCEFIPKLIVHFEIRTKTFRNNLLNSTDALMDEAAKWFSCPKTLMRLLETHLERNPHVITNILKENGLTTSNIVTMKPLIKSIIIKFITEYAPIISNRFEISFSEIKKSLNYSIRNAQITLLEEELAPEPRVKRYSNLSFRLVEADYPIFILPDSIITVEENGIWRPFLTNPDELTAVCLPISPTKCLIGENEGSVVVERKIPYHSASCSYGFFIAGEQNNRNIKLSELIGKNSQLLTEEEMRLLFDEILLKLT